MKSRIEFDANKLRRGVKRFVEKRSATAKLQAVNVMRRFETRVKRNVMSDRRSGSIDDRTGALKASLSTRTVTQNRSGITVRVAHQGERQKMIARVLARGMIIRPKSGPFLRFPVYRKYHRAHRHGKWDFSGDVGFLSVRRVRIRPDYRFENEWRRHVAENKRFLSSERV